MLRHQTWNERTLVVATGLLVLHCVRSAVSYAVTVYIRQVKRLTSRDECARVVSCTVAVGRAMARFRGGTKDGEKSQSTLAANRGKHETIRCKQELMCTPS